jgi:hypothetical protein
MIADVALQRQHTATARRDLLGGSGVLLGARSPDGDVGTLSGQGIGHAQPDATVSTGDQGDVAAEIEQIGHGAGLTRECTAPRRQE